VKAYEVVLRHIERQILAGELTVGSSLPPERELAAQLGVSRTAVREAIRTLAAQGLVTSRVGAGPGSGNRITGQHERALRKLLRMHVALSEFPVDEVVEARVMLERFNVQLAARHADAESLARLGDMLARMEAPHMELDEFNGLDTAYHITIAEIADNEMVTVLTSAVRESLARPIHIASEHMDDWQAFRRDLIRQHRRVFEAIAQGDEARAADLIEEHIRTAYAILPMEGKAARDTPVAPNSGETAPESGGVSARVVWSNQSARPTRASGSRSPSNGDHT